MTITFHAPQIVCISLTVFSFTALLFGGMKDVKHNVFAMIFATLIAFPVIWWGGFFNTFGVPQFIYCLVWFLSSLRELFKHGEEHDVSVFHLCTGMIYTYGLLIWGGFFSQ